MSLLKGRSWHATYCHVGFLSGPGLSTANGEMWLTYCCIPGRCLGHHSRPLSAALLTSAPQIPEWTGCIHHSPYWGLWQGIDTRLWFGSKTKSKGKGSQTDLRREGTADTKGSPKCLLQAQAGSGSTCCACFALATHEAEVGCSQGVKNPCTSVSNLWAVNFVSGKDQALQ